MSSTIPAHWLLASPPRTPAGNGAPAGPAAAGNDTTTGNGAPAGSVLQPPNMDDSNIDPLLLQMSSPSTGDVFGSSPAPTTNQNPRKRAAEDSVQYAQHVARKLRLSANDAETLKEFTQLTGAQQSIWLAAKMIENQNRLEALVPAEAVYHIPTSLEGHINKATFVALVDHTTSSYVAKGHGPTIRVINYLLRNPSRGLTAEMRDDQAQFKIIKRRVRDKLTHNRNQIKCAIEGSMGEEREPDEVTGTGEPIRKDALDIVTLCQRIVALGAKVAPDVKVSTEMVARVAYLRYHFQVKVDAGSPKAPNFWRAVDEGLTEVRTLTLGDPEALSRIFARSLRDDLARYGHVDMEELTPVTPSILA
ncbi:hypothetical protein FB45DRAFT_1136032 [Roridomyces roridus]|uniref:Uncharacterized protein n=1 Tax=Roridomyces roridus TaxID=1738132 RepID=A0AAD7F7I3_9AGAR|nr:hypothetical protein FB45DRAFT_1136032 [Roridomyces roridus]